MTAAIPCEPIAAIGPSRQLLMTTAAGTVPVGVAKDGAPALVAYSTGAFVLADESGRAIVGPVQIEAAQILAERIACGDARALTEPQNSLVLATAFLALCQLWPRPSAAAGKAAG